MSIDANDSVRPAGQPGSADSLRDEVLEVIVAESGANPSDIERGWALADLGVTSFKTMRLFMALEDRFDIEFSGSQITLLLSLPLQRFHEVVAEANAAV